MVYLMFIELKSGGYGRGRNPRSFERKLQVAWLTSSCTVKEENLGNMIATEARDRNARLMTRTHFIFDTPSSNAQESMKPCFDRFKLRTTFIPRCQWKHHEDPRTIILFYLMKSARIGRPLGKSLLSTQTAEAKARRLWHCRLWGSIIFPSRAARWCWWSQSFCYRLK